MGKLLKIVRIGNDVGVILPPEVLAELQAQLGDLVRIERGEASTVNEDHQRSVARSVMDDYQAALRELAK